MMRKNAILIAGLLAFATLLAGCTGGNDDEGQDGDTGVTVINEGPQAADEVPDNLFDGPTTHYHHYWGDLQEVTVFDGDVALNDVPNFKHFSKNTLYWAEFNLEDDGDDVTRNDNPVEGGKADTVFVGTKEIRVTIDFQIDTVERVFFQYQPANTNKFKPENSGLQFQPGVTQTIQLTEVGQADPAHQFAVSRWQFRIWTAGTSVFGDAGGGVQDPPHLVLPESTVHLKMTAVNGGESFLDPPHPNFWIDSDQISLGAIDTVTLEEPAVMTPLAREKNPKMTDIALPPGQIVPLGTEKVIVKLKYTQDFPPPELVSLGMAYHGADTDEYTFVGLPTGTEGDWQVWELSTAEEGEPTAEVRVDPPYESNSMWRFELVPIFEDGQNPDGVPPEVPQLERYFGGWQGSYEMQFEAVKLPDFILV